MRRFATAFVIALLAVSAACAEGRPQPTLPKAELDLATPAGTVALKVELATTLPEQEAGLMFRTVLGADEGMLFVYGSPQMQHFWMENTILPLDMVFIRGDGTVSSVHANAVPYDQTTISSTEPVRYVLEINAGRAAALGIVPGDRASGPALGRR